MTTSFNPSFITIEGVDGAGKTSHVQALVDHIAMLHPVLHTREPGGTPIAEELRDIILKSSHPIDPETETMLLFSARKHHLEHLIKPALQDNKIVICDRFTDSSWAYQHGGKKVSSDLLSQLEQITHPDLQPGLTLLFDLPVEVSLDRLKKTSKTPDRFESQDRSFFQAVRDMYLERARQRSQYVAIIDSNRPIEVIRQEVLNIIDRHLQTHFHLNSHSLKKTRTP